MRMCIDEFDITPGNIQVDGISKYINESRNILFVLSQQFCETDCVLFEIHRAKYEKFCRNLMRIIVIDRGINFDQFPVELGQFMNDILVVDWNENERESIRDKLKNVLLSGTL